MENLKRKIRQIDNRSFKQYKELEGIYNFGFFNLVIDHVQSDPFAPPSKLKILINNKIAKFPPSTFSTKSREIALRDYLTRKFYEQCTKFTRKIKGSGKSGVIQIVKPGQEILERNSIVLKNNILEIRFKVGLPAFGRKIIGKNAEKIFFGFIPEIVKKSLLFENINKNQLYKHIEVNEDADFLRELLPSLGLISFIADNSILPRKSGVDDRPLKKRKSYTI